MKVTFADRALFACRRFYNCTIAANIIGWSNNRLTIFGISIMSKQAVDALHSAQAYSNLKDGLSSSEYLEVCQALTVIGVLPMPELPDGSFSDRQKAEHGIRLVWNRFYVFSM